MKIGLVLEGGAMRGMYTAGVLDVMHDAAIGYDCAVGVSAGALFGINYFSGQKGRVIRYNKKYNGDPEYMGLRPLLREGNIVSTDYAYNRVPRKLDPFDNEAFRNSGIPFYAVVTDIDAGKAEYVRIGDVFEQMDTLRASGSMPFVSRPVILGGKRYLDGAISDAVPYAWLSEQGCDKLVVVLTRDISYRKSPENGAMVWLKYRKYPKLRELLTHRHEAYNASIARLRKWESEGRAFVVRPSMEIKLKRIEKDPQKLQAVYDLGVGDMKRALDGLRAYLEG